MDVAEVGCGVVDRSTGGEDGSLALGVGDRLLARGPGTGLEAAATGVSPRGACRAHPPMRAMRASAAVQSCRAVVFVLTGAWFVFPSLRSFPGEMREGGEAPMRGRSF